MKKVLIVSFLLFLSIDLFSQSAEAPSVGDGSEGNPFQIGNLENLYWVAADTTNWDKYYIQTEDINASETRDWFSGKGWLPIGNEQNYFSGTYYGDGHLIDSLYINRDSLNYVGMFGSLNSAVVEKIGITNIELTANNNVGALAGQINESFVVESYSTGAINGKEYVGGLVGLNSNSSYVLGSYSRCRASGNSIIGGLVAYLSNSYVIECYSEGRVVGAYDTGGLIGFSSEPEELSWEWVINCLWNYETSEQGYSYGGYGTNTIEMKNILTFLYYNWDFVGETANGTYDIWDIDGVTNNGYPFLSWQETIPHSPNPVVIDFSLSMPKLSWDIVDNAESYSIYSSIVPYATFPENWLHEINTTETTWVDTSATGVKKFYIVTSVSLEK